MSGTRGTKLTYAGLNLLAACQTGKELHFTKVVLGDGEIAAEQDIRQLSGMVNIKLVLPIKSVKVTGTGLTTMETELKNQNLAAGFFAREVGIFATGSDGTEILYAYRNTGSDSEYIPAGGGSEVWDLIYDVVTVVDQAENITATINGDIAYVTRVDFREHTDAANHPYYGTDTTATDGFFAHKAEDSKIHKMSIQDTRRVILGDEASTIPVMRSRIAQLETELDNVTLKMVAADEAPDSNLLITEDFKNPDMVDTYAVKVNSAVAGDNGIDIETDSAVITGSWYWISDGINSEYIQLKSVIKNGSVYRVLATENLKNTYNLPVTYMYRTTSLILDGTASGSGDRKGFQWKPTTKWSGVISNVAEVEKLETTQDKADDFVVTGDGAFSSDGFFTLQ